MKKVIKYVTVLLLSILMITNTVLAASITIMNKNGVYSYIIDGIEYNNAEEARNKLKELGYSDSWIDNIIEADKDITFTSEDVLLLLDKYDKNGAYIIRDALADGENILRWWSKNDITDALETAIHEECHHNTNGNVNYSADKESIYVGDGKNIEISYDWRNGYYRTEEMADNISQELRTFRYNTYVAKSDDTTYVAANSLGIYGLLNEFQAYCWGMNNIVSMLPYYINTCKSINDWSPYTTGTSVKGAYYEFNYWILGYMIYAKEHYPAIYDETLNNMEFIQAYKIIDDKYNALIDEYDAGYEKVIKSLNDNGYTTNIEGNSLFAYDSNGYGQGVNIVNEDINILKPELEKAEYKQMYNILKGINYNDYKHLSDVDNELQYSNYNDIKETVVSGIKPNSTVEDVKNKYFDANVIVTDCTDEVLPDCNIAGTGCKIYLIDSDKFIDQALIVIKGDTDGTGTIDVLDMETIQKSILGIGDSLSGVYKEAALLNGDDKDEVTVLDMEAIQKDILGIQKIN